MEIQILSGDQQSAVEKFADSIGIPPSKCGATSHRKVKRR